MQKTIFIMILVTSNLFAQAQNDLKSRSEKNNMIVCKLTSPELQERKKTVIAEMKSQIVQKIELEDGFKYIFDNSDKNIDMLTTFVKTERLCCPFFIFKVIVGDNDEFISIDLIGPQGTKEFINSEIGF